MMATAAATRPKLATFLTPAPVEIGAPGAVVVWMAPVPLAAGAVPDGATGTTGAAVVVG